LPVVRQPNLPYGDFSRSANSVRGQGRGAGRSPQGFALARPSRSSSVLANHSRGGSQIEPSAGPGGSLPGSSTTGSEVRMTRKMSERCRQSGGTHFSRFRRAPSYQPAIPSTPVMRVLLVGTAAISARRGSLIGKRREEFLRATPSKLRTRRSRCEPKKAWAAEILLRTGFGGQNLDEEVDDAFFSGGAR